MLTDHCLIFGAGGHAKVVLESLLAAHPNCKIQIRDDDRSLEGSRLLGFCVSVPCLKTDLRGSMIHVAVGENVSREILAKAALEAGCVLYTIVNPTAVFSPSALIGQGVFIAALAVVGSEAVVGDGVIVNHGAVIDHDCKVGAWSHVAPRAVLGGGVRVGTNALLGSGCIILPGLSIGNDAVVGAGSVVTHDVTASVLP